MAAAEIRIPPMETRTNPAESTVQTHPVAKTTLPEQQHWLYPTEAFMWNKLQTYPSQRFLDAIARHVHMVISAAVESNVAKDLEKRINHFFYFVCGRTPLSRGQILHAVVLLQRLIKYEAQDIDVIVKRMKSKQPNLESPIVIPKTVFEPVVTEGNLGTLLLCALCISVKINEDVPFNNKFWSNLLHIDIRVVNSSESVFLQRLRFDVHVTEDDIKSLAKKLDLI